MSKAADSYPDCTSRLKKWPSRGLLMLAAGAREKGQRACVDVRVYSQVRGRRKMMGGGEKRRWEKRTKGRGRSQVWGACNSNRRRKKKRKEENKEEGEKKRKKRSEKRGE